MSLIRARLSLRRLSSATHRGGTLLSFATRSFEQPCLTYGRCLSLSQPQYATVLFCSPYSRQRFASTSAPQHTDTAATKQSSFASQPHSSYSSSDVPPAAVLSTTSTWSAATPPHPTIPSTTPLATALSAEMSALPAPPPPSPTASRLARPFITAMHQYPLALLLSLAVLEVSSFSLTNQLLLAAGVQFSSTFAWAYLISVPIRRSAIVKAVLGVPLGCGGITGVPVVQRDPHHRIETEVSQLSKSTEQHITV